MISIRVSVQIAIATLALLLAGCSGFGELPGQQFTAYQQAFGTAQAAAKDVLGDYAWSQKKVEKEIAAIEKNKKYGNALVVLSSAFDPSAPSAARKKPSLEKAITIRLQALNTIGRYNEAVLAIVRGGDEERVGASLGSLSDSVTALAQDFGASLPGLGLASPIVSKFLALAERARDREIFAKAIRAGAPVIAAILDFLKKDTVVYDDVQRTLARHEIDRLSDRTFAVVIRMARLAGSFAEPPPESDLAIEKRAVALDMQAALKGFGENPASLPYKDLPGDAKGPSYTVLAQSVLDLNITAIKDLNNRRSRAVALVLSYREMLSNYVSLLEKVSAALQVVEALETGNGAETNIGDTVATLAGLAFRLHGEITAIRQIGL